MLLLSLRSSHPSPLPVVSTMSVDCQPSSMSNQERGTFEVMDLAEERIAAGERSV